MKLVKPVLAWVVPCGLVLGACTVQGEPGPTPGGLALPVRLKAGEEYIDTGAHVAHAGPLAVDLDKDGRWQLVGQTRGPFSGEFDDFSNNYQFWGGIRFRPNSWR